MTTIQERAAPLLALVEKASAVLLESAQITERGETWECQMCGGEGYCEADSYTNIDGLPVTVQFFGIGDHFGNNQAAWNTLPDLAALLREALVEIERLNKALRRANENHERFEREWYLRGDALERIRDMERTAWDLTVYDMQGIAAEALTPNAAVERTGEASSASNALLGLPEKPQRCFDCANGCGWLRRKVAARDGPYSWVSGKCGFAYGEDKTIGMNAGSGCPLFSAKPNAEINRKNHP